MKLFEVSIEAIRAAISNYAGGIIVIMPTGVWNEDLVAVCPLIFNFPQHRLSIESDLLKDEFQVPLYFILENKELESLYRELQKLSHDADKPVSPSMFVYFR